MDVAINAAAWSAREMTASGPAAHRIAVGHELFGSMRALVGTVEQGARSLFAGA